MSNSAGSVRIKVVHTAMQVDLHVVDQRKLHRSINAALEQARRNRRLAQRENFHVVKESNDG